MNKSFIPPLFYLLHPIFIMRSYRFFFLNNSLFFLLVSSSTTTTLGQASINLHVTFCDSILIVSLHSFPSNTFFFLHWEWFLNHKSVHFMSLLTSLQWLLFAVRVTAIIFIMICKALSGVALQPPTSFSAPQLIPLTTPAVTVSCSNKAFVPQGLCFCCSFHRESASLHSLLH